LGGYVIVINSNVQNKGKEYVLYWKGLTGGDEERNI